MGKSEITYVYGKGGEPVAWLIFLEVRYRLAPGTRIYERGYCANDD